MRNAYSTLAVVIATGAVIGTLTAQVNAAVVYSSISPATQATLNTISGDDGTTGIGDDYNTGLTGNVVITGLSFYGGLSDSRDQFNINFYNTAETKVATIYPSASNLQGVGLHSLLPSDFTQNGTTGVTIPSSGYIVFAPVSYTTSYIGPNGQVTTPGDPNPTLQLGFGGNPTVGTNDPNNTVAADGSGNLTFGTFATGSQIAEFSLSTVPEPASIALFAPMAMILKRRRRA